MSGQDPRPSSDGARYKRNGSQQLVFQSVIFSMRRGQKFRRCLSNLWRGNDRSGNIEIGVNTTRALESSVAAEVSEEAAGSADVDGGRNVRAEMGGDEGGLGWDVGRRIIELAVLAKGLSSCSAETCDEKLDLMNIVNETRIGFASLLYIPCKCGKMNKVPTGKSRKLKDNCGVHLYDINSKSAIAMIHAGVTATAMQRIFAVMEVPSLKVKALKKREREVGDVIESTASYGLSYGSQMSHNKSSMYQYYSRMFLWLLLFYGS